MYAMVRSKYSEKVCLNNSLQLKFKEPDDAADREISVNNRENFAIDRAKIKKNCGITNCCLLYFEIKK